jgi:hypothetical protein
MGAFWCCCVDEAGERDVIVIGLAGTGPLLFRGGTAQPRCHDLGEPLKGSCGAESNQEIAPVMD